MILAQWRARRASKTLIEEIRGEIVAAARRPELYEALATPDRIDGRFELLTLHAGLVLRRLGSLGGVADAIAQDLVDSLFAHFDDTLREIGYSDIGVSKRLKSMGSAFYGRNAVYAAALDDASPDDASPDDLAAALARNVYGAKGPEVAPKAEALARHIASLDAALATIPIEVFTAGRFRFPLGSICRRSSS
ncbi:MAG TPA: ubiquinol-cytochrome C chaperone family protein [Roseiarcus sp.]|nr:ubiquinol-cytochrome C chaperone family protein [Roseiarcus sp.]